MCPVAQSAGVAQASLFTAEKFRRDIQSVRLLSKPLGHWMERDWFGSTNYEALGGGKHSFKVQSTSRYKVMQRLKRTFNDIISMILGNVIKRYPQQRPRSAGCQASQKTLSVWLWIED